MKKIWKIYFTLSISILFCRDVYADLRISEIMYDLSGSDAGREWVEVENANLEPFSIDTKNFKLVENNSNHNLTLYKGSTIIGVSGFFVIANDPTRFLADWPNFSGTLFKSNFSLNNSGDSLAVRISSTTLVSTISFSPAQGANGDGNSLQLISGVWKSSIPTPGNVNVESLPIQVKQAVVKVNSNSELVPIEKSKNSIPVDNVIDGKIEKVQKKVGSQPVMLQSEQDSGAYWFFALGGIILLGISVILLAGDKKKEESIESVEDYEIIE